METTTYVSIKKLDKFTGLLCSNPTICKIDDIDELHKQMLQDKDVISYRIYDIISEIDHAGFTIDEEIENTSHTYWIVDKENALTSIEKLTNSDTVISRNGEILWAGKGKNSYFYNRKKQIEEDNNLQAKKYISFRKTIKSRKKNNLWR